MIEVPLKDNAFSHVKSGFLTDRISKIGKWKRTFDPIEEKFVLLTHTNLEDVYFLSKYNLKIYAWIIEPEEINPKSYEFIRKNYQLFEKIFTWDKSLSEFSNNFVLIYHGTCWIDEKDCYISKKSKNLSMMLTKKRKTYGHNLRHTIYENFKTEIDIFGRDYKKIENKITALKDYRFQIVIENVKKNYCITEKIIDCLQTGTVPIYWGCPSIRDLFNTNGIILFEDLSDLEKIIPQLDKDFYDSMIPYIKENYELSKKYIMVEDQIFQFLKNDSN